MVLDPKSKRFKWKKSITRLLIHLFYYMLYIEVKKGTFILIFALKEKKDKKKSLLGTKRNDKRFSQYFSGL